MYLLGAPALLSAARTADLAARAAAPPSLAPSLPPNSNDAALKALLRAFTLLRPEQLNAFSAAR